jgi:predicted PP-loop superfamily ATPase
MSRPEFPPELYSDEEWSDALDEVVSEEPEFIEAIQEYVRNGKTQVGSGILLERIQYLCGRCEDRAEERILDRKCGRCA